MATPPPLPNRGKGLAIRQFTSPVPYQFDNMPGMPSRPDNPNPRPADPNNPNEVAISLRDVDRAKGNVVGRWIIFNSQAINKARFDYQTDLRTGERLNVGTIKIEYINLKLCGFPDRSLADFLDIFESSSKGRFNWEEIRGPGPSVAGKSKWTFYTIRDKVLTPAQVKKLQKSRAPIGAAQKRRTYTKGGQRNVFGKGGRRVKPLSQLKLKVRRNKTI